MEGQERRLFFACRFGAASAALGRLITDHGTIDQVSLSSQVLKAYLPPSLENKSLAIKPHTLDWLQKQQWQMIALGDPDYPPLLANISDAPGVLFVRGSLTVLQTPQLAMVGARGASAEGLGNAGRFAAQLAQAGFTITSGLANGIDGAAHRGALQTGRTLAVMATGPERFYPASHQRLAEQIVENGGALVTEFPPGIRGHKRHFPQRNRIITGMSLATLVIEAVERSGSLISARLAGEQGREVFAMPGSVNNTFSRGCHQLLREGANWLETPDDVLSILPGLQHLVAAVDGDLQDDCLTHQTAKNTSEDTPPAHPLLTHFTSGINTLDDLSQRSGLAAAELTTLLTTLEIDGQIIRNAGGYALTG